MPGPYQKQSDVLAEPMPQAVAALTPSLSVRPGEPDPLVQEALLRYLLTACDDAGVELGAVDLRRLEWLSGWSPYIVQVILDLIRRAHAAGLAASSRPS